MNTKSNNNLTKAKQALRLNNFKQFEEAVFSTEVARKVCHVSYRILGDWDRKGVLPHRERGAIEGWRTFGFYDLLVIKIIALMRENGVPIRKVKKVYDWLNNKEEIIQAVERVLQESTYIATNLRDDHLILSEKDFGTAARLAKTSMFAFKLDPILDELSKELKN